MDHVSFMFSFCLIKTAKSLEAHEYCMIKDAKFATPLITLADFCCTPRVNKKFSVLFIERAGMRILVILDDDWLQL